MFHIESGILELSGMPLEAYGGGTYSLMIWVGYEGGSAYLFMDWMSPGWYVIGFSQNLIIEALY